MSTETMPDVPVKVKKTRNRKPKPAAVEQVADMANALSLDDKVKLVTSLKADIRNEVTLRQEAAKTAESLTSNL